MVVWMPAHTSEGDIDKAVCSNGQRLTGAWRSANELADQLAKMAAETVRVPSATRIAVAKEFKQAKDIAMFVGRLTVAAGAFANPDGTISRDSEEFRGKAADGRRSNAAKPKPVTPKEPEVDNSMSGLVGRVARLESMRQRILRLGAVTAE